MLEGGSGGGCPRPARVLCPSTRPASMSKHETGTVTKQTTGALQFMVAFALRGGGGGCYTSANISHFVVPWEAGGPSPDQHASDLYINFKPAGWDCHKGFRISGNIGDKSRRGEKYSCPTEVGKVEADRGVQQAYAAAACARKYVQQ